MRDPDRFRDHAFTGVCSKIIPHNITPVSFFQYIVSKPVPDKEMPLNHPFNDVLSPCGYTESVPSGTGRFPQVGTYSKPFRIENNDGSYNGLTACRICGGVGKKMTGQENAFRPDKQSAAYRCFGTGTRFL
jgi:hypothetical protein